MYKINARQTERAFIRKVAKTGEYKTANGKANFYVDHTNDRLIIKTVKSQQPLFITRRNLRAAINYTYYVRTITRQDLESYSKLSSALLGILMEVFKRIAKLHKTATGLLRLTIIGIRFFFAGADRAVRDMEIAAANGAKFVLLSYYHIRNRKSWRGHVERLGLKILLDSGEFSRWQAEKKGKQLRPIKLEEYAEFIRKHKPLLYAWFNLDVVGDAMASKKNAEYLKAQGLAPIEIWHVSSSMEALDALVSEDHAVIAIGGSVGLSEKKRKRIFNQVFVRHPKQNFHGLGVSGKLLYQYPWFSADSTCWTVGRKYGAIIGRHGQRKVTGMEPLEALAYNVRQMVKLEVLDANIDEGLAVA